jgi:hypothetical protein
MCSDAFLVDMMSAQTISLEAIRLTEKRKGSQMNGRLRKLLNLQLRIRTGRFTPKGLLKMEFLKTKEKLNTMGQEWVI